MLRKAFESICERNMRSVDTNVLVRLIVGDDETQLKDTEEFVAPGAWVSQLVLAETIWVADSIYGLGAEKIANVVEMLLAHESLTIQDPDVVSAALASFRNRPTLGFSDCLIIEIARKAGHIPLGTFDTKLAKIEGTQKI